MSLNLVPVESSCGGNGAILVKQHMNNNYTVNIIIIVMCLPLGDIEWRPSPCSNVQRQLSWVRPWERGGCKFLNSNDVVQICQSLYLTVRSLRLLCFFLFPACSIEARDRTQDEEECEGRSDSQSWSEPLFSSLLLWKHLNLNLPEYFDIHHSCVFILC